MPDQPAKRVLQATGRTVAHIWFETERTRTMRREEERHLAFHVGRLLTAEGFAAMEWKHFGMQLEVKAAECVLLGGIHQLTMCFFAFFAQRHFSAPRWL